MWTSPRWPTTTEPTTEPPACATASPPGELSHSSSHCLVELADLRLLLLTYVGDDGRAHAGQLVVHRDHARDLVGVFAELYRERFPIRRMQLVDD